MESFAPRDGIISYLRSTLFGPAGGEAEKVMGTPFLRYMTGILFPVGLQVGGAEDALTATAEEDSSSIDAGGESRGEQRGGINLASEALPSAVGISFKVADVSSVTCSVWAGIYEELEAKGGAGRGATVWTRRSLASAKDPQHLVIDKRTGPIEVFEGKGRLVPRWRSMRDGSAIVTVALVNNNRRDGTKAPDPAACLFQVGLRCEAEGGILAYPEVGTSHDPDSEEAEVEFLYRSVKAYARGHGAATTWGNATNSRVDWVAIDFVPSVDVPRATFELSAKGVDANCFDLPFLISADRGAVIAALGTLADAYEAWVARLASAAPLSGNPAIALKCAHRAGDWLKRMRMGLELIAADEIAWRCFRMANEAMAMQMVLAKARPKVPYGRSERRGRPALDFSGRSWRPFQVAFFLGSIESLLNQSSLDRRVVDVIWFPTGGGKTEAYLLVSAFELIRRRLVHGDSDTGTAILSRYTLRFLTAQQFQRTGALMIALELLRRRIPEVLGQRQFTLGLWVGGDVTPNTFRKAHDKFQEQFDSRMPKNLFQLQACPCCGTEIFPTKKSYPGANWSADDFGVVARPDQFFFRCASKACEFTDGLPMNVIDDALYEDPPSLILGTVDKFAMLPWDDRGRAFFGGPDGDSPPPSLVLQDELHLISGPLGSLAAPYDAALDTVIAMRGGSIKRIGSTATIRNARQQVMGLYGRPVAVFPTPGSKWDDAFFFSTDRSKPGRTYVGVMGQGYVKPVVAMAWTSAAILQSVREVTLDAEARDSYWTLLAYHNSRRELGRTLTAARDEVQARIETIASSSALVRTIGEPLELSAHMVKSLGEAIEALEKPHSDAEPSVDIVPCTSIISVGVDIERLGVMLMNGQPKLTSEYIQATSRVGRGNVPGLVVSLFAATKPRDRSHYEDFRAYHEAIYRHVEPTSVTPYALPARERTLHAALVAVIRHATHYSGNEAARQVDFDHPLVRECVRHLLQVMCESDPTEADEVRALMEERLREWREVASAGFPLLYERRSAGHQFPALLAEFGKARARASWPTMMSVRNVDEEIRVRVD